MVRDIIDKAIITRSAIEMEYSKDGVTSKFYQLCKVAYSPDYGNKCFRGCPIGSETELIFRLDRVKDIQLMWDFIFEENIQFDKSGIYALSFMGDNYLEFGLYNYNKGEKLLAHYQSELFLIQAFHYIPYYSETKKNQWLPFDQTEKLIDDYMYVFAFTIEDGISVDIEEEHDYIDYILGGDYFKLTEHSGIYYRAILGRWINNNLKISEGVNILAYNRFPRYSDDNLGKHNDIMWELYHGRKK